MNLTAPTRLYDVNGTTYTKHYYLFYDATVELFSKVHLPYALLAFAVLLFLVLLPLILLCLYPCSCFQRLLNCCRLNCQALRIFMDSFQCCYKIAPLDCRYFAGLYLILRISYLGLFFWILDGGFFIPFALTCVLTVIIIVVAQPYKQPSTIRVDVVLLLCLAIGFTAAGQGAEVVVSLAVSITLLCFLVVLTSCLCKPHAFPRRTLQRFWVCLQRTAPLNRADSIDTLPDRLENPEEYEPMLPPDALSNGAQGRHNGTTA